MPTTAQAITLVDQLAEIRALLGCAFMACTALDDEVHGDALQSLLAVIEDRVDAITIHAGLSSPCPVALAA